MSDRQRPALTRQDFVHALEDLDSYIDVTVEDLMRINDLAQKHARLRDLEAIPVHDAMTREVVSVAPSTPLPEVVRRLLDHRIAGLPVVDEDGVLAGLITEADLLQAMGIRTETKSHSVWQTLESLFRHTPKVRGLNGTAADIMVTRVVTLAPERTVGEAIDAMKRHHVKRLVIVDGQQRVQGVVTRSNLVRVFLEQT